MTTTAIDAVVLCDTNARPTGMAHKLEAHAEPGMLHRAFSVFVFRNQGREVLLQKRSREKKLFASLWANTCCSHPSNASQDLIEVATNRLWEEFGFAVPLCVTESFVYFARDGENGVEHEHDTVLVGHAPIDLEPNPNPQEISEWKWMTIGQLRAEIKRRPEQYAPWLKPAFEIALEFPEL